MNTAQKILAAVMICVLTGCVSVSNEEISKQAGSVNRSDGINKAEAVWLAQEYILQQNLQEKYDVNRPARVTTGIAWERAGERIHFAVTPSNDKDFQKGKFWAVSFYPKRKAPWWQYWILESTIPMEIRINAGTGAVESARAVL